MHWLKKTSTHVMSSSCSGYFLVPPEDGDFFFNDIRINNIMRNIQTNFRVKRVNDK